MMLAHPLTVLHTQQVLLLTNLLCPPWTQQGLNIYSAVDDAVLHASPLRHCLPQISTTD